MTCDSHPETCSAYIFQINIWGFLLKWWVSPTTMGFPTKNDHFEVFWGYHHLRKHQKKEKHHDVKGGDDLKVELQNDKSLQLRHLRPLRTQLQGLEEIHKILPLHCAPPGEKPVITHFSSSTTVISTFCGNVQVVP